MKLASGYARFALRTSGASSYLRGRFAPAWYGALLAPPLLSLSLKEKEFIC
jgi:hypothetical protein